MRLGDAPHGAGQGPFHGARPGGDRYPLLRGGGCREDYQIDSARREAAAWRRPDPTGNAALALADNPDGRRVALIEQCAGAVAEPVTAAAILKSVTEGQPWSRLRPPCGEKQFYVLRLLFYIELDRRL